MFLVEQQTLAHKSNITKRLSDSARRRLDDLTPHKCCPPLVAAQKYQDMQDYLMANLDSALLPDAPCLVHNPRGKCLAHPGVCVCVCACRTRSVAEICQNPSVKKLLARSLRYVETIRSESACVFVTLKRLLPRLQRPHTSGMEFCRDHLHWLVQCRLTEDVLRPVREGPQHMAC